LRSEKETFKSENEIFKSENERLKSDNESLKTENESLKTEIEILKERVHSLEAEKCNRAERKRLNSLTFVNKNQMKKPVIKFVDNQLKSDIETQPLRPNPND